MKILEMQKKIEKILFDFYVFTFELVLLNIHFYWDRILVIGCECINKMSQDYRDC